MSKTAPQIGELLIGEIANVAIDCSGFLDAGETITGSVSVAEQESSDLSISAEQANSVALDINGLSVAMGMAVQCRVDATNTRARKYTLLVTAVTSAAQTRKGLVTLEVVG